MVLFCSFSFLSLLFVRHNPHCTGREWSWRSSSAPVWQETQTVRGLKWKKKKKKVQRRTLLSVPTRRLNVGWRGVVLFSFFFLFFSPTPRLTAAPSRPSEPSVMSQTRHPSRMLWGSDERCLSSLCILFYFFKFDVKNWKRPLHILFSYRSEWCNPE